MKNLTIAVEDPLIEQARMRAIEAATALTQPEAPHPGRRRTLREELYASDFRARDRTANKTTAATKAGGAPRSR